MTRRTPIARVGLLTLAVLQLSLSGAAAWADARLDAGGPRGPVHFESHSTGACAAVHPADCMLHRFLSTVGSVPCPTAISVGLLIGNVSKPAVLGLNRSKYQERLPEIRGPPLS